MGWASGGEIFDEVADSMIRVGVDSTQMTEVLASLIQALKDGDWDTESESMDRFHDNVAVMDAFRKVDPEEVAEYEEYRAESAAYYAARDADRGEEEDEGIYGEEADDDEDDEDPNEPADNDDELPGLNHIQGICPGGTACTCDERDDRGVLE